MHFYLVVTYKCLIFEVSNKLKEIIMVLLNVFAELFNETTDGLDSTAKVFVKCILFVIMMSAMALIAGVIIVGAPTITIG